MFNMDKDHTILGTPLMDTDQDEQTISPVVLCMAVLGVKKSLELSRGRVSHVQGCTMIHNAHLWVP